MSNLELAKKIIFLVTRFHNNPEPFTNYYNTFYYCDENTKRSSDLSTQKIYIVSGVHCIRSAGRRHKWINKNTQEDDINDIITFNVPMTQVKLSDTFSIFETIDISNRDDYTEELMFQYSCVYSTDLYNTLEIFLYLKDNCTLPFMMNLGMFDIDEAIGLYKDE